MSDHDEELTSALQDYYRAVAQQPAPDVTERIMMSADRRTVRIRRWTAIGGGALAAAAVGAVVAVAFVNHNQASPGTPAHSATPGPTVTAAPPSPSPSVTPSMPQSPPLVGGLPVHGFVPTDVTAISSYEWWVIGFDGPTCSSTDCTRIVHTTDGGFHFTSLPTPPVAPARNGQQALRLRFADASDGWVVDASGQLWATHDGGQHWTGIGNSTRVTDLEASGGSVFAIGCPGPDCWIEQSSTSHDVGWSCRPRRGPAGWPPQRQRHARVGDHRVAGRRTGTASSSPPTAARASASTPSAGARWGSPISTQTTAARSGPPAPPGRKQPRTAPLTVAGRSRS